MGIIVLGKEEVEREVAKAVKGVRGRRAEKASIITIAASGAAANASTASTSSASSSMEGDFVPWRGYEVMKHVLDKGGNVLLVGPAGCGKTMSVFHYAKQAGVECIYASAGEITDPSDLLGCMQLRRGETRREEGVLIRAMLGGHIFFLDEFYRLSLPVRNVLYPVLAQRILPLDGKVYKAREGFRFVAATNPYSSLGTNVVEGPMKDRFDVVIDVDYLPIAEEEKLVAKRCALEVEVTHKMCLVAGEVRGVRKNNKWFGFDFTPRRLFAWGDLYKATGDLKEAYRHTVLQFPDPTEGRTRRQLALAFNNHWGEVGEFDLTEFCE